jgi:outer membrane protein OmpA-like peptidoglycan-associated protein
MKRIALGLLGATALACTVAAPVFADESDKIFINQLRDKIAAARADPAVAQNGSAELDRAEAALKPLLDNLDENETKAAKDITGQIDALIETAKVRAKTAAMKEEVARLRASGGTRVAEAQAAAAAAQESAARAQVETAKLKAELRDYQMKQTQLGATLVLQDVVFATGRAELKPGAAERLRPLASYLQANPQVKVRIDGHTDAQGSDAYNQALSERRAAAVRAALASMGIDPARIETVGHGEANPLADNRTAAGRQQNRRVEVTLVGQQASSFAAAP